MQPKLSAFRYVCEHLVQNVKFLHSIQSAKLEIFDLLHNTHAFSALSYHTFPAFLSNPQS